MHVLPNDDPIQFEGLAPDEIEAAGGRPYTLRERAEQLVRNPAAWATVVVAAGGVALGIALVTVIGGRLAPIATATPTPVAVAVQEETATPTPSPTPTPTPTQTAAPADDAPGEPDAELPEGPLDFPPYDGYGNYIGPGSSSGSATERDDTSGGTDRHDTDGNGSAGNNPDDSRQPDDDPSPPPHSQRPAPPNPEAPEPAPSPSDDGSRPDPDPGDDQGDDETGPGDTEN